MNDGPWAQLVRTRRQRDPYRPLLDVHDTFQRGTRRLQAGLNREAFEESGDDVVEASRRLDIARSHVCNPIRAFGLERGN